MLNMCHETTESRRTKRENFNKKTYFPIRQVEALLRNLQRARNTRNPSGLEHPIKRSVGNDSLLSLGRVTNSLLASFSLTGLEC